MSSITVERATRGDVPAVVDCWVALADDQRTHGSHLLAEENRSSVREHVTHHVLGERIFVARTDGEIVGFVQFSVEIGTFRMDVDRGIVETLYVRPEYRNRGVGSRLLENAEAALSADGITTVALEVMVDNADARRFYEDRGYRNHRLRMEKPLENDTH